MTAHQRYTLAGAVFIFALTVGIRLLVLWDLPWPTGGDACDYRELAVRLLQGEVYGLIGDVPTAVRPPGYPLFLAGVFALLGESQHAVLVVETLLAGLVAVLLMLWLARYVSLRTGLLAGLIWAGYPGAIIVYYGPGSQYTETLFALLIVLAQLLAVDAVVQGRRSSLIAAAVVAGLCLYVKPGALLLPAALAVVCAMFAGRTQGPAQQRWRRRLLVLAGMCVLAYGLLIPWVVRNWVALDAFVPLSTRGGITLYYANHADAAGGYSRPRSLRNVEYGGLSEVEWSARLSHQARRELLAEPGRVPYLMMRKLLLLFDPGYTFRFGRPGYLNLWYVWLLPLALYGLACGLRSGQRHEQALSWSTLAIAAQFCVICLVFFGDPRFRFWFEPAGLLVAMLGVEHLWRRWPHRTPLGLTGWLLVCVLLTWQWQNLRPVLQGVF